MTPMRPLLTTPTTRSGGPPRFPLRTLLLMVLALVAFGRLWWITHRSRPAHPAVTAPRQPIPVRPLPPAEPR